MKFKEPDGATPLDPDEIEGLKFDHITTRGELDELEQASITQGLQWLGRRRGGDILTEDFIRTLHRHLFGEVWSWAGSFSLREKNIGIDPFQIPVQLRYLLDDARYWAANVTYPPLEASAQFHHRMVQIHLFPHGNGRHARIAADEAVVCLDPLWRAERSKKASGRFEGLDIREVDGFAGAGKIPAALQVHPVFRRGSEERRETQRRIDGERRVALDQAFDARARNLQAAGKGNRAHAERFEVEHAQHLTGMERIF